MSNGVIVAVDLGGTRIRAAICDSHLNILNRKETYTKASEGLVPTLERIKDLIHEVLPTDGTPVLGIGICAPGPLNPATGVVVAPPNLPGWHNVPLGDLLKAEFGVPVYVGNDANVAALAEAVKGAGVGYRHVVYITVSTGVGGGIISDGYLLQGSIGLGAEAGHMLMLVGDRVSSLELETAGTALARKAREQLAAGASSEMLKMVDGQLEDITGAIVGQAANDGDALAVSIVQKAGTILGYGIVTLLHLFNPQIVIVGGGVAEGLGDLLMLPAWEAIKAKSLDAAYWQDLKIVPPLLGEDVSLVGSAALVLTSGGVDRIDNIVAKIKTVA
ncbi:MAG: ROK family protein [Phototrophicaceae bacterium]